MAIILGVFMLPDNNYVIKKKYCKIDSISITIVEIPVPSVKYQYWLKDTFICINSYPIYKIGDSIQVSYIKNI